MADKWASLRPDDRIYLLPQSPSVTSRRGLRLGSNCLHFLEARLIVRRGDKRLIDQVEMSADLPIIMDRLAAPHRERLRNLIEAFQKERSPLAFANLSCSLSMTKPRLMGVLNVTPDSFSDGGKFFSTSLAVAHARAMYKAGADIIDIGGESTRPGADPVSRDAECERIIPVIEALAADAIPISVDSRNARVMKAALDAGATMINDVSALTYDPDAITLVRESKVPVVLMHALGSPKTMQEAPYYQDVLLEVFDYLEERRDYAISQAIDPTQIILDVGIGFGKRLIEDNVTLLNGLALFHSLGCPILLGVSRKHFIGEICNVKVASARGTGSLIAGLVAIDSGVQLLRVHDVLETRQAFDMHQALSKYTSGEPLKK